MTDLQRQQREARLSTLQRIRVLCDPQMPEGWTPKGSTVVRDPLSEMRYGDFVRLRSKPNN